MKYANSFFSKKGLFERYGENPGTMLVHTGLLGWILSSLAQITAIVANDKIPSEQKKFLIPQEAADGLVNIFSFYVITSSFKLLGSKLVSTGKLASKNIKAFLNKSGVQNKVGKLDFNISRMENFNEIKSDYKSFKNGVDVIASTVGSIVSCNIFTPIVRNECAARIQKRLIDRQNKPQSDSNYYPYKITMDNYQKTAYSKYSSSGLKI